MINYYNRSPKEYKACKPLYQQINARMTHTYASLAVLIVGALFLLSMVYPLLHKFSWYYAGTVLSMIPFWLLSRKRSKLPIWFSYVVISLLLGLAIELALVYPDQRATVFPMLLLLLPLLITDTMIRMILFEFAWTALYSILILNFKAPQVQSYEIFSGAVAMLISIIAHYYYQRQVLNGFAIQLEKEKMIVELRIARKELVIKSERDTLTDLLNRNAFIQKIEQLMKDDPKGYTALGILDIDSFKQVNDQMGHQAGDQLIKRIGHCLQNQITEPDYVGRLGGDEFIFYLQNRGTKVELENKVKQMQQELSEIMLLNNKNISSSVGVTFVSQKETEFDEMYRQADVALYRAKESGKNAICYEN